VRTHLENIYQRLNVTSRTAAVTRAFPDGVA
jgi:DNA-binding NarL/FixJ family response regulator